MTDKYGAVSERMIAELSETEFDLLVALERLDRGLSCPDEASELCEGRVDFTDPEIRTAGRNLAARQLIVESELFLEGKICGKDSSRVVPSQVKFLREEARQALEKYRVRSLVIMAAGKGVRMLPLTLEIPKPLVSVNGVRFLDSQLRAARESEIERAVLVCGYMWEQFEDFVRDYRCEYDTPEIILLRNPDFADSGNVSSPLYASEWLQSAYVAEADLLINNNCVLRKYERENNYLGFFLTKSEDWCFYTDDERIIERVSIGGENVWQMVGISYWDAAAGLCLRDDLPKIYAAPGGRSLFWDEAPLREAKDNYAVRVRPLVPSSVTEIDTLDELIAVDPSYKRYR
ncbi:MAG: NTP transferase domain-containing protein [Clostridiaceae bacterium]|nr:NTP transferase domain-containing protein [Clostridiaceae bacterium]